MVSATACLSRAHENANESEAVVAWFSRANGRSKKANQIRGTVAPDEPTCSAPYFFT